MIRRIPAASRHYSNYDWLKTYWLFSFADYYDPDNTQFGALRVFNDDTVAPGTGFPTHPHKEMEIVTMVLSGEITHADSMGNRAVIKPGDVQRMSAGTGLTHSEYNLGHAPVHFFQVWFFPDVRGTAPSYDQRSYEAASWRNHLRPVASGQGIPDVVSFQTDATIYRAVLDERTDITFHCDDSRRVFIYLTAGRLDFGDVKAVQGDQVRVDLETVVKFKALEPSEVILIDSPSCKGFGYDGRTLRGIAAR
jgi:quercetin 2,3-dioxygenase